METITDKDYPPVRLPDDMSGNRRMATPYYRATDKVNLVKIMAAATALALFVGGMVGATVILAVIECT